MAETLTREQQMAVDNRGGKLLVSAAAGSGKTKVLVDRLLKYLMDPIDPANIDDFLIITYTKAAAAELRSKIAAKIAERIAQNPANRHLQRQLQRIYLTKISTVHSFCSDILREYAYRLDISADFRVGDENECQQLRSRAMEQILEEAYDRLDENPDFRAFVDTQGLGRSDALVPEIVARVYDSAMCHVSPQAWREACLADGEMEGITDPAQTPWGAYLMEDLFTCLDDQIRAMEAAANLVAQVSGLEKPAALLSDTVRQLRHLRQSKTWDEVVSRKTIDYGRLLFPKKADDPAVSEPVKAVRAACKDQVEKKLRPFSAESSRVLADLEQTSAAARGLMALVEAFGERYSRLKRQRRILDFSNLEHKMLDLVRGKRRNSVTQAAMEIGDRFREIMVDEYQDSNGVQDAIFSALTEKKQNLFMVGDVKQSIYQFRLADPGIFLQKYADYAHAEDAAPGQGRKILLSSNFRSGGGVVEAVNHVFASCMFQGVGGIDYGEAEALREGVPHGELPEPEIELCCIDVQEDTYGEEAAYVADRIAQLLDGTHVVRDKDGTRPIKPEDVVILLRSPGSVGMEYRYALEQRGIRCAAGSGTDLLLTKEIGTLHSLLQVISNPRQDIPLIAALSSPVFGYTADDLVRLRCVNRKTSLYSALCEDETPSSKAFLQVLGKLRSAAAMCSLPELLEQIFALTKLNTIYASMEDGEIRSANLESFYHLAVNFGGMGGGDLDRFLEYLDVLSSRGMLAAGEESPAGCVSIMSIHKSKGLEFPVVFLCGLSRKFNTDSLRQQVLCHREMGLGLSCVDRENRLRYPTISKSAIACKLASDSLSEEMRVLYVALTRPKDRLIMTYAAKNIKKELKDLALRMDLSGRDAIVREVSCPGSWVLYSAMHRAEAASLFVDGCRPKEIKTSQKPWHITLVGGISAEKADEFVPMTHGEKKENAKDLDVLARALSFRYAHVAATQTPSKQTATQRKARYKDQEAAELTQEPRSVHRTFRKPSFLEQTASPTTFGNAIHGVMQYIRYSSCTCVEGVQQEIQRLVQEQYLPEEYGRLADAKMIYGFFATSLGQKLIRSNSVIREFKFSILDDASRYGENLEGEQVLLQGVVDCAMIEGDGITVLDFKTDYVTLDTVGEIANRYRVQVQTYADALSRIYHLPIKQKLLYLFRLGQFCQL